VRRSHPDSVLRVAGIPKPVPQRPRVLILVTLAEVGGAQSFVTHLLPALVRSYDVVVAAHGPGPMRREAEATGARFVPLRHVRREVSLWRDPLGLAELIALCRRVRPHVVHANSSKAGVLGLLAAALAAVPVRLFSAHGWPFLWNSGPRGGMYRSAALLIGRWATTVVCVSEAERRAGLAARICRPERTVMIPNAVDVSRAPRARHEGGTPTIISVGRLAAPKDFATLARALAGLEAGSFRAWIVGDGPGRAALGAEVERLGLGPAVRLLGERNDVPELLARADVFVLSSRSEGLPLSMLEAMAVGLPVVGSAVGGIPELAAGCGFLAPAGDPDALAATLRPLVADPALRRRHGDLAREHAQAKFDLPRLHRDYLDLYARELARAGVALP
jgi:glycosyltransferase involved in cell wall biosynthesis